MNKWDNGVEFDAMLNNFIMEFPSSQYNSLYVFIFLEQCFDIYGNWSNQCHIQLNHLRMFNSPQIE